MRIIFIFLICFSGKVFSAEDSFKIVRVFVTTDGRFAIEAPSAPVNANAERSCHPQNETWAKSWFGFEVNEKYQALVGALLAAQARDATLKVVTDGCLGNWHKITSVYGY